jgi:polyvinyl alcohol dehydrogenase (cytochrome)
VLADGRVYFGAADANVYCLNDKGKLLWKTSLGNPDQTGAGAEGAHAWSSPAIFDGKVFVGRASHEDAPCIRGRFYALDQDTGAILWQSSIVPETVCSNAPATTCTTDAECPGGTCVSNKVCAREATQFCTTDADCNPAITGNFCVESRGGAITSSAAIDAARNHVYVTTGDCLQQGAIGDAESIMAFDVDTGARLWATRANPIGETADFDYIASPSVFTATDGVTTRDLVGAGNKNGAFYAVDRDTGALVWSTPVVPGGVLGGYIGSHAVAGGRIFSGTFTGPPYVHALDAFDGTPGALGNPSSDALTFAAATYANGVVFNGSQLVSFLASGTNALRGYDAATGAELLTVAMPGGVASGAAIVDGRVYVGYGNVVDGNADLTGGVRAFGLP